MEENISEKEIERRKLFLQWHEQYEKIKAEGFAGCLPNGDLVDRLEYPDAIPLQENSLLNIPKPQTLPKK